MTSEPRATYDAKADVLYVTLADCPADRGVEDRPGIVRRYDGDKLVGITIVDFVHQFGFPPAARSASPRVTDEMVERGAKAMAEARKPKHPSLDGVDWWAKHGAGDEYRRLVRIALEAALNRGLTSADRGS